MLDERIIICAKVLIIGTLIYPSYETIFPHSQGQSDTLQILQVGGEV